MNFQESLSVSLNGLTTHKLRSMLTMLGIIFGVSAVIYMLSIGAGAKKEALDQIKLLGTNNVIIRSYFRTTTRPAGFACWETKSSSNSLLLKMRWANRSKSVTFGSPWSGSWNPNPNRPAREAWATET